MDKSAIKKFAIWARNELIEKISQKAAQYGINESCSANKNDDTINGTILTKNEKIQRVSLIDKIKKDGYQQVIEEGVYLVQ